MPPVGKRRRGNGKTAISEERAESCYELRVKKPTIPCSSSSLDRRQFVAVLGAGAAGGLILGVPGCGSPHARPQTIADESAAEPPPDAAPPADDETLTNLADFMKVPRGEHAIPGPFPGRVVQVTDSRSLVDDVFDGAVIAEMIEEGITKLTGVDARESFDRFFTREDVVGLKVNPVGGHLMGTRLEVIDGVLRWLLDSGLPKENVVIWDRFEHMLTDSGITAERFPGIHIEGLQILGTETRPWRDSSGKHISAGNFDQDVYYYARGLVGKNVRGYESDEFYLNQHVFNGEYSYFGKLLTRRLTKIINLPVFKNTGPGISMATKNLGYGSICNTGRLHEKLFFSVCTEVLAAPPIRDKLVLNITDGLRGQYEGGPMPNEQYVYPLRSLYFATDPFALDMICHNQLTEKREAMGIEANRHPRFTQYLHDAEKLGLGVANVDEIEHVRLERA